MSDDVKRPQRPKYSSHDRRRGTEKMRRATEDLHSAIVAADRVADDAAREEHLALQAQHLWMGGTRGYAEFDPELSYARIEIVSHWGPPLQTIPVLHLKKVGDGVSEILSVRVVDPEVQEAARELALMVVSRHLDSLHADVAKKIEHVDDLLRIVAEAKHKADEAKCKDG